MSLKADNKRVNFASIKVPMPCPDFLEVQLKSFEDFLQLDTPPEKRVVPTLVISATFGFTILERALMVPLSLIPIS